MDELIATVNSKQAQRTEAERNHRKEKDCKVILQSSALAGMGFLILGAMWLPVLAIPAAWCAFTAAVVVADRHIRRK